MNDGKNCESQCGIVYVAFGYEWVLMAANSAYTAKQHNPRVECNLVTNVNIANEELLSAYFDRIYEVNDKSEFNRNYKTSAYDYATFEKGVLIDPDTEIWGDLSPMFKLLDTYDVILRHTPYPDYKDFWIDEGIHATMYPTWSSGVLFFRKGKAAKKLFSDWNAIFKEMGKNSDQPPLACAVYKNPDMRFLSANSLWNTAPRDMPHHNPEKGHLKSRIWHYRHPKKHPDIACRIYEHHPCIKNAVEQNGWVEKEIKETEYRYKIITSFFYRNRLTHPIFMLIIRALGKCNIIPRFEKRKTRLIGDEHKVIKKYHN